MINRKVICFLIIVHILPSESKADSYKFWLKLVSNTKSSNNQTVERKYKTMETSHANLKCKYKCITAIQLAQRNQARFIDQGSNDTIEDDEMEAPAGKFSIFNLLSDDEKEEEDEDHKDDSDDKTEEKDDNDDGSGDDEEDEEDEEDFNFFYPEDDITSDKLKETKQENLLKQYHRHTLRMHHLMFPLLLAYKLKFFTVIPLLLGLLVLLIGTTGIAGFFFALFAAALGIHVKMQNHHN